MQRQRQTDESTFVIIVRDELNVVLFGVLLELWWNDTAMGKIHLIRIRLQLQQKTNKCSASPIKTAACGEASGGTQSQSQELTS